MVVDVVLDGDGDGDVVDRGTGDHVHVAVAVNVHDHDHVKEPTVQNLRDEVLGTNACFCSVAKGTGKAGRCSCS